MCTYRYKKRKTAYIVPFPFALAAAGSWSWSFHSNGTFYLSLLRVVYLKYKSSSHISDWYLRPNDTTTTTSAHWSTWIILISTLEWTEITIQCRHRIGNYVLRGITQHTVHYSPFTTIRICFAYLLICAHVELGSVCLQHYAKLSTGIFTLFSLIKRHNSGPTRSRTEHKSVFTEFLFLPRIRPREGAQFSRAPYPNEHGIQHIWKAFIDCTPHIHVHTLGSLHPTNGSIVRQFSTLNPWLSAFHFKLLPCFRKHMPAGQVSVSSSPAPKGLTTCEFVCAPLSPSTAILFLPPQRTHRVSTLQCSDRTRARSEFYPESQKRTTCKDDLLLDTAWQLVPRWLRKHSRRPRITTGRIQQGGWLNCWTAAAIQKSSGNHSRG